jgi:hypothetical protein
MAVFQVTLHIRDDADGIRVLRAALKLLLRKYNLRAVKIDELSQSVSTNVTDPGNVPSHDPIAKTPARQYVGLHRPV